MNTLKHMIQVKANKESELFKTTQDIGYELETIIYTSEDKLNITIDNDKIPAKYRTFVIIIDKDNVREISVMGYEETLSKKQIKEQFEILSKDASEIKKANTLHS